MGEAVVARFIAPDGSQHTHGRGAMNRAATDDPGRDLVLHQLSLAHEGDDLRADDDDQAHQDHDQQPYDLGRKAGAALAIDVAPPPRGALDDHISKRRAAVWAVGIIGADRLITLRADQPLLFDDPSPACRVLDRPAIRPEGRRLLL